MQYLCPLFLQSSLPPMQQLPKKLYTIATAITHNILILIIFF